MLMLHNMAQCVSIQINDMLFKLLLFVWCSTGAGASLYPIVIPHRLYNYSPPENEVTFHFYHR